MKIILSSSHLYRFNTAFSEHSDISAYELYASTLPKHVRYSYVNFLSAFIRYGDSD